jgi:hypothetical protein
MDTTLASVRAAGWGRDSSFAAPVRRISPRTIRRNKTGLLDSAMFDPSKTCLFIFLLLILSIYYLIQYYAQRITVLRHENSGVLFRHGNACSGESHFADM